MAITGRCLCGAVRFSIDADAPLALRQFWCRVCQSLGAGSGTVEAIFRAETLAVSGPLTDTISRADSGSTMRRRFCAECGAPLLSQADERPHHVIVRTGALDDPNLAKPSAIIRAKSAPGWACFDPSLPQTEAQPGS